MYTTWASRISIQQKDKKLQLRHKGHADQPQHTLMNSRVLSDKLKPDPQPYPNPKIQKISLYPNSTKISGMAPPTTVLFVHSVSGAPLGFPSLQLMGLYQQLSYDTRK